MGWRDLSPSEGVGEADWIRRGLHQALLLHDLGTVIPQGFDAYARILHPAPGAFGAEVRWSEVAAWNEKTVHAEMQFHAIGGPWNGMPQGMGPRVGQPSAGRLSDSAAYTVASNI